MKLRKYYFTKSSPKTNLVEGTRGDVKFLTIHKILVEHNFDVISYKNARIFLRKLDRTKYYFTFPKGKLTITSCCGEISPRDNYYLKS